MGSHHYFKSFRGWLRLLQFQHDTYGMFESRALRPVSKVDKGPRRALTRHSTSRTTLEVEIGSRDVVLDAETSKM